MDPVLEMQTQTGDKQQVSFRQWLGVVKIKVRMVEVCAI